MANRILTALAVTLVVGCTTRQTDRTPNPSASNDAALPSQRDASTAEPADAATSPREDAGPPNVQTRRETANVYWVGHSLVDHRDVRDGDSFEALNVVEIVGTLAGANGQTYDQFRHTTPGAPLWWNWLREEELARNLLATAQNHDVIVITESIPIWTTYTDFFTSFYARQFACAALRGNPNMAIYIYETWPHLYAGDQELDYPEQELWDFRAQLTRDRQMYEAVTTEMRDPNGARPSDYRFPYEGADPGANCAIDRPVYIIPGGQALAALWDRLRQPAPGDDWEGLTMAKVFQNGYTDWPSDWPVTPEQARSIDANAIVRNLTPDDRSISADDIHMSFIGSYYIGLVAYATIYRTSPVGGPTVQGLSPTLARKLQDLAWQVVLNDPMTGIQR